LRFECLPFTGPIRAYKDGDGTTLTQRFRKLTLPKLSWRETDLVEPATNAFPLEHGSKSTHDRLIFAIVAKEKVVTAIVHSVKQVTNPIFLPSFLKSLLYNALDLKLLQVLVVNRWRLRVTRQGNLCLHFKTPVGEMDRVEIVANNGECTTPPAS